MAFGNGEDHGVLHRAGVKLSRTHQIAHIFQHHQVQVFGAQALQPLARHIGVQMAHTAGMKLDHTHTCLLNGRSIHVGINVSFHHAHFQLIFYPLNGAFQRGRLAAAGGRHEIQQKGALGLELTAQLCRIRVIICKNALFDFDHFEWFHR